MMPLSIRLRLSAWYFAVLFLALISFGVGTWLTIRQSLLETVDDGLRDHVRGVRAFMDAQTEAHSLEETRAEFLEYSALGPGGDLFQVCDEQGNWLYRSAPLARNQVGIIPPSKLNGKGLFEDLKVRHARLRLLSARVEVHGQAYAVQVAAPVGELDEALAKYRLALFLLIPAVLAVASGGGYWLSRRALAPVDRIIRDAQSISSQSLQKRLDLPMTGDELQRLSETLNQMLERLDLAFRRITQFTADASHELRTPIAVIRTTAELALRRPRSSPDYECALREILAQSERTTELIESLLTLARADTGNHDLQQGPVSMEKVINEASAIGRMLASSKGLGFTEELAKESLVVQGDAQALRRLVLILIDNAVKYTTAPGAVQVRLGSSDRNAVLEVQDTGIGITPDDLPHIFERFYRADPARGSDSGGAGLGLSIAQWIAQQHGGEIAVESRTGRGSTFRVSLPMAKNRDTKPNQVRPVA
jgi:heavy metal sensor kinase